MRFVEFMGSIAGRGIRIAAGVVLIIIGLVVIGGVGGVVVAAIGLVPIAAGLFNFCLVGPLFGADLRGRARPVA